jgi:predicted aspartyl protease
MTLKSQALSLARRAGQSMSRERSCFLAALFLTSSPLALADEPAIPESFFPEEELTEVVVQAKEPRYVAPTRRDRIGRIWAPVYINERGPFRLVLDTGSSHAAVNAYVAQALGMDLTNTKKVMLRGVTGARVVPTITVESLIIGDLQLRPARLPIVVDALGGADGVLGTDGLLDKRIFIDFRNDRITIFRSRMERAPRGYITIPVKIEDGLLLAKVQVGSLPVTAIIDTGGQGSIANKAFQEAVAKRIRANDFMTDEITGATLDVQKGSRVRIPPIQLGDVVIRQAHITSGDFHIFQAWDRLKSPTVLLGMDVLGLFDVMIIDYRRRELQVLMRRGGTS